MPSTLTEVDIANIALTKMGEETIADLGDNNVRAKTMDTLYVPMRDRLLRENKWNFSIKRTTLSADSTDPNWGFAKRFAIPADMLAFVSTESNSPYRLEGNFIHSDVGNSLKVKYIARITDATQFDTYFVDALAALLAAQASLKISNSLSDKQFLLAEMDEAITNAKRFDGWEDDPQVEPEDAWIDARRNENLDTSRTSDDGGGSL